MTLRTLDFGRSFHENLVFYDMTREHGWHNAFAGAGSIGGVKPLYNRDWTNELP